MRKLNPGDIVTPVDVGGLGIPLKLGLLYIVRMYQTAGDYYLIKVSVMGSDVIIDVWYSEKRFKVVSDKENKMPGYEEHEKFSREFGMSKIEMIKFFRNSSNITLVEAKHLVEHLTSEYDSLRSKLEFDKSSVLIAAMNLAGRISRKEVEVTEYGIFHIVKEKVHLF